MGIANLVYHYLVTTHHGSHYDYNIWAYYAQHGIPQSHWSHSMWRVFGILKRGGI